MHVVVEPGLVEGSVFQATRAELALASEYQHAFAMCYRETRGDRRDQEFAALHDRWFDRLGLRARIVDRLAEFAHIAVKVNRFVAVDARNRARSGAELFGKPGRLALVLALTPSLLLDSSTFDGWARFELQHIEDMLDPAFGYDAARRPGGEGPARANLAHDRFVVLWAMSVDARLNEIGRSTNGAQEARFREFMRAFRVPDTENVRAAFQTQWDRFRKELPTHASLVEWAEVGNPALGQPMPAEADEHLATPGARCALCGFTTFDWAARVTGPASTVRAIQADFPIWTPRQPICKRCDEIYRHETRPHVGSGAAIH